MKLYALSDVEPLAITLCKKGANRQRIFLRKEAEVDAKQLLELPADHHRLLKSEGDWSVAYCVVAEPGAHEEPGQTGAADSMDVWASADEIRKAAHNFARNKGYVNLMHDALAEEGCNVVENAIALTDMEVGGETIKKGSWYLAIEPNAAAKAKIDAGEIEAVSLEGTGVRTLIEKATGPGGDIARNQGKQFGPLKNLIKFYLKKPHPFTACVRDNRERFGDRAENVCAALKDIGLQTTKWRKGNKGSLKKAADGVPAELFDSCVESWTKAGLSSDDMDTLDPYLKAQRKAHEDRPLLQKIADVLGIEGAEDLAKAGSTFDEIVAERELNDELPKAWSALQECIWRAYNPRPDDAGADPKQVIEDSLDQFKEWATALLDRIDSGQAESLAKELATLESRQPEDELDMDRLEQIESTVEALKKESTETAESVKALTGTIEKLVDRIADGPKKSDDEDGKVDVKKAVEKLGEVADKLDAVDGEVSELAKSVAKLAEGESTQSTEPDTEKIAKTDNPLAGLLA